MSRIDEEKNYWNTAATDPQVDVKYISDIPTKQFEWIHTQLFGKVLEIGCGVGRLMKPGYYGIDISNKMLKIAQERQPDCRFKLADGRIIPYSDSSFDSVYSVLVFQHLPLEAVAGYIAETKRILKKRGVFIFQFIEGTEDAPFSKHHSLDEIKKLLIPEYSVTLKRGLIHPLWTWVTARKI